MVRVRLACLFFQAEDGIRDLTVTGVQTCALPILDRNKAGGLLSELSTTRNRKLLDQLRAQALDSLIEMAHWRSYGHAYSSRILLGRIAGIEETRLQNLVDTGQVEQIVKALQQSR